MSLVVGFEPLGVLLSNGSFQNLISLIGSFHVV